MSLFDNHSVVRAVLAAILTFICFPSAFEQDADRYSHSETRALWVVRTSLTSPQKIANLVRRAADTGFNVLFVQVRGRGDAYYLGGTEPRAEELEAAGPDFDPLATAIGEAEKMGLKVHAWVNVYYVWSGEALPKNAQHWVNARQDRLVMDPAGVRPLSKGAIEGAYLCPSDPEVQAHLRAVIKHLAANYRLAGIHLDYIRYPDRKYCYCPGCLSRFLVSLGDRGSGLAAAEAPKRFPSEWADWRREQVSSLVKTIRADLREGGRTLPLTAAVWADRTLATQQKLQDWPRWCREGWLDALVPMNYTSDEAEFLRFAKDIAAQAGTTPVIMGIGAWRLKPEEVAQRIRAVRQRGFAGFSLFSYGSLTVDGTTEKNLVALRETVSGKR